VRLRKYVTTYEFMLLVHSQSSVADRPRTSLLPNPRVIFVVDDDPSMRMSIKRLLRKHGYDSVLFSSAEAFKNQVDFENVRCVVLDINLQDGSGIELRYGLKAAGHSVPVIYITASDNPAVRKAALESGCIALLAKPFSVQELMERLKKGG
jgi:FixJ family two-component response regulator